MKPSPGELARREQKVLQMEAARPLFNEVFEAECYRLLRKLTDEATPTYEELLDIRAGMMNLRKLAMSLEVHADVYKQLARGDL